MGTLRYFLIYPDSANLQSVSIHWRTQNEDDRKRSYSYNYDALNRIKDATYLTRYDMLRDFTGHQEDYTLEGINYDQNGNILQLRRFGATNDFEIDIVDDLTYNYYPNSNLFNRHFTLLLI